MKGFAFDEWAQLVSERLVGDQINRSTEPILEIELDPKIPIRGRGSIKGHQQVNVAIGSGGIASG